MFEFYFSILTIYAFIAGGVLLKKIFKEKIDTQSVALLTVYFFQPMLVFWGLSSTQLGMNVFNLGIVYFISVAVLAIIFVGLGKFFIRDPKIRSIFIFSGTSGNTGNLGIPLGLTIFGPTSLIYTTMINFANVFWSFIFGVYFYSRGKFSIPQSIKNIFKMPILWVGGVAIILNFLNISMNPKIEAFIEIGGHASIAIQLFLFGLFLAEVKVKHFSLGINLWGVVSKFVFLPLVGLFFLKISVGYLPFSQFEQKLLLMQCLMPLAVNNINLASLYDCKHKIVTQQVFFSTIVFLVLAPIVFYFFIF